MLTETITAHHEAAHAVVQYRASGRCADDRVTIHPSTTTHHAEMIATLGHASGDSSSSSDCAEHEEARVLSCYAGGHAQRRCDPETGDDGCDVDDDIAAEILRYWGWEAREQEFRDRSRALVDRHWAEIAAVATELRNVHTLDGAEVGLLADAAAGVTDFAYGDLARELAAYRAFREQCAKGGA